MPTELHGKYTVEDKTLGQGAWSVVKPCKVIAPYIPPNSSALAGDGAEEVPLVAKVIDKEHLKSLTGGTAERAKAEVDREVSVLRALPTHPNIAAFIELLETPTHFYIIFEEAAHGDLCEVILKAPSSRLAESDAKKYCVELILAVLHCHRHGIAHRDVKPENLLVGRGNVLKLTDFGLAKMLRAPAPTNADANAPPPTYVFDSTDPIAATMYPHRTWAAKKGTTPLTSNRPNAEGERQGSPSPDSPRADRSSPSGPDYGAMPPSHLPSPPICEGHEIIGTLRYGAPEMFQAKFTNTSFDAFMADAWSIGVVAYIMLTGSFPFSAGSSADERQTYQVLRDTPLSLPPSPEQGGTVSHSARDFLRRLLIKDPKQRLRLWDALDHAWIRDEVKRQRGIAADTFFMPSRLAPSQDVSAPFAFAVQRSFPLPKGLQRLREFVAQKQEAAGKKKGEGEDDANNGSSSSDAEEKQLLELQDIYNHLVDDFAFQKEACARLRQHAIFPAEGVAGLSSTAGGSSSARSGVSSTTTRKASQSPVPSNRPPSRGRTPASGPMSPTPGTPTSAARKPISSPVPSPQQGTRLDSPARVPRNATPERSTGVRPHTNSPAPARRAATPVNKPPSTPTSSGAGATESTPQNRRPSPLARASPVARRGTPLRRPGSTSTTTPSKTGTGTTTASAGTPASKPAVPRANGTLPPPASPSKHADPAAAAAASVCIGDQVTYRNFKATVHFVGTTQFAAGQWVGLEMLEGHEGIHDGTSSVDRRRYFTCPPKKGVFVRPSQVKKVAAE